VRKSGRGIAAGKSRQGVKQTAAQASPPVQQISPQKKQNGRPRLFAVFVIVVFVFAFPFLLFTNRQDVRST
jgi:hypothetical protein